MATEMDERGADQLSGLCIGVTGHRTLAEARTLERRVEQALRRLDRRFTAAGLPRPELTIMSSLAEGADRLVARVVLRRPGARLLAILPLPPEQYQADFATAASKRAFDRLLGRAEQALIAPAAPSRETAYAGAGRAMLAHCGVLIALWDGLPGRGLGGTAELVAEARARAMPLLWIRTDPPFAIHEERMSWIAPRMHHPQPKPASTA
ncbi:MAG TPA: hypothetical protein VNL71_24390 [Chloroflexota bacterium]|nr:hypothetical protein [Chloroflexota bacterium]